MAACLPTAWKAVGEALRKPTRSSATALESDSFAGAMAGGAAAEGADGDQLSKVKTENRN